LLKPISRMTVKSQLMLLILVFATFSVIMVVIILKIIMSSTANRTIRYSAEITRQMEVAINKYSEDNYRIAKLVAYNKGVQKFILSKDMSETLDIEKQIRSFMENTKELKENIKGINLFFNDSRISYGELGDINKVPDIDINKVLKPLYSYTVISGYDTYYYFIVPIFDTEVWERPFQKIGTVVITLDVKYFIQLFKQYNLLPGSTILILDSNKRVVACNDEKLVNNIFDESFALQSGDTSYLSVLYNKEKYVLQSRKVAVLDWNVLVLLPEKKLLGDIVPSIRLILVIGILELLFSIIISVLIIKGITGPIREITDFASKVGYSSREERLNLVLHNELKAVVQCVNSMLDQKDEMTRRVFNTQEKLYQAQLNEKIAELNALQTQINPHFLYNTLECVRSIAEVYGANEIRNISISMSDIFRYSINHQNVVRIMDEIECVKNYFNIIDIRFRSRFQMEIECDESLLECEIIKMILQPIVENAVYHGLEAKIGRGCVIIRINQVDNDTLEFSIKDNGKGIPSDSLIEIRTLLGCRDQNILRTKGTGRSVGLLNIQRRIMNYYGDKYSLYIESEVNVGTSVTFRIPKRGGARLCLES
jgi:two-component system sensor histidine kinase YesM